MSAAEMHDIERTRKRRVFMVGPKGKLVVETVDKISSGKLMHNGDGSVSVPSYKREFEDGRPGWQMLDKGNCTPAELAVLNEWLALDEKLNGRAPPIPIEKRPRIVRERLLASLEADNLAGVNKDEQEATRRMIAAIRTSLEGKQKQ